MIIIVQAELRALLYNTAVLWLSFPIFGIVLFLHSLYFLQNIFGSIWLDKNNINS